MWSLLGACLPQETQPGGSDKCQGRFSPSRASLAPHICLWSSYHLPWLTETRDILHFLAFKPPWQGEEGEYWKGDLESVVSSPCL